MNIRPTLPAPVRLRRAGSAIAAAAVAVTALAACGGTTATPAAAPSGSTSAPASASVTGTPAAPSAGPLTTTGPLTTAGPVTTTPAAPHNDADVTFAQMMIVHHEGAIGMADLAPDRAAAPQVKELAERIKAAQAPEIAQMTGWLTVWGAPTVAEPTTDAMGGMDHSGHDMGGGATMPGMSEQDMAALSAASGADFDRLFLQQMVVHHQGAIDMSATEIASGANPDAIALARKISTDQTAEISQMQGLLNAE